MDRPIPRLFEAVVATFRVRHYPPPAERTEDPYPPSVDWSRRFIEFHERTHPRQLAEGGVNGFLCHLALRELAGTRHASRSGEDDE
jgi:hypothetical protein